MKLHAKFRCSRIASIALAALLVLAQSAVAVAAQVDIHGPPGSVHFGSSVTVLPNGNIVVVDPDGPVSNIGAVYLFNTSGTLISTLTGVTANDHVGSEGIFVVGASNFVVCSKFANGSSGAATWVNGTTGLNDVVSVDNSLVGNSGDAVCEKVVVLSNGNYVVSSQYWTGSVGAATWGNGSIGIKGQISAANSLVGSAAGDDVGAQVIALSNGNYVVGSEDWSHGATASAGAATWGSGTAGIAGAVSESNSLYGTTKFDRVGNDIFALTNGNYVVKTATWQNGVSSSDFGAVTWGNGLGGTTGAVSGANSLVGTTTGDGVGTFFTPLTNGNYVVSSLAWNNGIASSSVGAVTWGDGVSGTHGPVSTLNSLVGTTQGDSIGSSVVALSNGNYVVGSSNWNNGSAGSKVGAATWGDGTAGTVGFVSNTNSLIGSNTGDLVGRGIAGLTNGHYVVDSPEWATSTMTPVPGAATWEIGTGPGIGVVNLLTSLIATNAGTDFFYSHTVALSNGNYVVACPYKGGVGSASWFNGTSLSTGFVDNGPTIVGSSSGDQIGFTVVALTNGNYVVAGGQWTDALSGNKVGAFTWGNGATGTAATVSLDNSFTGSTANDFVSAHAMALSDGNYVVFAPGWDSPNAVDAGAIALGNGRFPLRSKVASWNSVVGTAASNGYKMVSSYDASRHRLAVGRPGDNILSLFTMDQIFADAFEP